MDHSHGVTQMLWQTARCCNEKKNTTVTELCNTLPSPFATFLLYKQELSFTQKPNYSYALSLFRDLQADAIECLPILPVNLELSEQSYWMESLPPQMQTPQKKLHNMAVPTSVKRYVLAWCHPTE